MSISCNKQDIETLCDFLDEIHYKSVCFQFLQNWNEALPRFSILQATLKVLDPFYAFIFCLFRMGHVLDYHNLKQYLPPRILSSILRLNLLTKTHGQWKFANNAIIPFEQFYLLVSLPQSYPGSPLDLLPCFPFHSDVILPYKSLPGNLKGKGVLELHSRDGVLGMGCIEKGASKVTIHVNSAVRASYIKFNLMLNRLDDRIIIDLDSKNLERRYFGGVDYLISAPYTLPKLFVENEEGSKTAGPDGLNVIRYLVETLPRYLNKNGRGLVSLTSLGDEKKININEEIFTKNFPDSSYRIKSLVINRQSIKNYINCYLEEMQTDWERLAGMDISKYDEKIENWFMHLKKDNVYSEFIYQQLFLISRITGVSEFENHYAYNEMVTDRLFNRTLLSKLSQ